MTYEDFLNEQVKGPIKSIGLDLNLAWHAFILDSIVIEFIGKLSRCKCVTDISKSANEKNDFINAIKKYFPSSYHPHAEYLYTNFRCGAAHFFGPKVGISLATTSPVPRNLEILKDQKLLLVFDEFHNDLCKAIDNLIAENKPILKEVFIQTSKK